MLVLPHQQPKKLCAADIAALRVSSGDEFTLIETERSIVIVTH